MHDGVIQVTNSTTGTGGSHGLLFGCDGLNVQFKQQENAAMLFLVNSATPRMNIAPGGNVAIGNGSTAGSRLLELKDNNYQLRLTYDASNYSDIGTNSTGSLILNPIGSGGGQKIGMGTASPNSSSFTTIDDNSYANTLYVVTDQNSGDGIEVSSTGTSANGINVTASGTSATGIASTGKTYGIYAIANGAYAFAGSPMAAVYGSADGSNNSGTGTSGNYGVQGVVSASQATADNYGVAGRSQVDDNGGTMNNYGVYGIAGDADFNAGIYGTVSGSTGTKWAVYANGDAGGTTSWNPSDNAIKENVQPLENALENILLMSPKTYQYKTDEYEYMNLPTTQQFGFLADDVKLVFPDLVKQFTFPATYDDAGTKLNDPFDLDYLNYVGLVPVLFAAVQELSFKLDALQAEVDGCCGELSGFNRNTGSNDLLLQQALSLKSPRGIYLGECIPNPHSLQTTIPVYIPTDVGHAELVFHDQLGREIERIQVAGKGASQILVSTRELQNGTYTYSLIADDKVVATHQMLKQE